LSGDRQVNPNLKVFDGMQERIDRTEACTVAAVRRVAAMLDLDPVHLRAGDPLPRGWHFIVLGGETRRSSLRADGFPGFGVPMPDLGLPRLLLAGREVEYQGDLVVGASVFRRSWVSKLERKSAASGPSAVVTIHHELSGASTAAPVVIEEQTYILLGPTNERAPLARPTETVLGQHQKSLVPDETLLFQYSAIGFNSHKIHIDRDYARNIEGLPDLVVNGGLTTLLLTEFMRLHLGVVPARLSAKHRAPLYCGRSMTLAAASEGSVWTLKVHDSTGVVAVVAEVHAQ
jgi:3-methylfumaryl-CoA hydratase